MSSSVGPARLKKLVLLTWLVAPVPAVIGVIVVLVHSRPNAAFDLAMRLLFGLGVLTLLLGTIAAALGVYLGFRKLQQPWLGVLSAVLVPVYAAGAALSGLAFALVGVGHGRPFRVRGRPLRARAQASTAWASEVRIDTAELSAEQRRVLARLWLDDALLEHASVAAFAQLSQELMAVGAPPALLSGCHRAAGDEVRHAELTFGIASAYAGEPLGPSPFAEAVTQGPEHSLSREQRLVRLATQSLVDGVLHEGIAARVLALAARQAQQVPLASLLSAMADDEAEHAALARDILEFCLTSGGPAVVHAVTRALGELDASAWGRALPDLPFLPSHGRPAPDDVRALSEATLRHVRTQLEQRLAKYEQAA